MQSLNRINGRFESPVTPLISTIAEPFPTVQYFLLSFVQCCLKRVEHYGFTNSLQSPFIISHFIPSLLIIPPLPRKSWGNTFHRMVFVYWCAHLTHHSQGSCQRWRWSKSNVWETGGEHLALWDHARKSWFKISVNERQLRDTWQFYHRIVAHTVILLLMWWHVLIFYWCLSISTLIWMQWLDPQSCFAFILSQPYTTLHWKFSREEFHLFIPSPRKYWQRLDILSSTGVWGMVHWVVISDKNLSFRDLGLVWAFHQVFAVWKWFLLSQIHTHLLSSYPLTHSPYL